MTFDEILAAFLFITGFFCALGLTAYALQQVIVFERDQYRAWKLRRRSHWA